MHVLSKLPQLTLVVSTRKLWSEELFELFHLIFGRSREPTLFVPHSIGLLVDNPTFAWRLTEC